VKELSELHFPQELKYSVEHKWVAEEGNVVIIGITDYAQDQLGDVVFVELPSVGDVIEQGSVFGTVESVKAVSELFMPITGEIIEINEALDEKPSLINESPYKNAWMIKVKPLYPEQVLALLENDGYIASIQG